jgi:uncharacterized protein YecE (DUF72 family)
MVSRRNLPALTEAQLRLLHLPISGSRIADQTHCRFCLLRLHGPTEIKYHGSYGNASLKKWAKQCIVWQKEKRDVYVYFDNDQEAYAAFNALSLRKLLKSGKQGNLQKRRKQIT